MDIKQKILKREVAADELFMFVHLTVFMHYCHQKSLTEFNKEELENMINTFLEQYKKSYIITVKLDDNYEKSYDFKMSVVPSFVLN